MQMKTGLIDHGVLQRTERHRSDAAFSGVCSAEGKVAVRVRRGGRLLSGFTRGRRVGQAQGGRFSGRLRGVPTGGPYTVELTIADASGKTAEKLNVRDVLVGDVWILAGQSNMQGCGDIADAHRPHPLVRAFYMDDRWAVARDSIHNVWDAVDAVHLALHGPWPANPVEGVGPGVAFGVEMHRRTGAPQGLIPCAHGATSMVQWDPRLKHLGGDSLYGATMRRVAHNGGRVAGVVWYQGESECDPEAAPHYARRMKELIAAFRRDLGDAGLPFVGVQLSRFIGEGFRPEVWHDIQVQQEQLARRGRVKRCAFVPAIDVSMSNSVHVSGVGCNRLGRRLGQAMDALCRGRRAGPPPIRLRAVRTKSDPITGGTAILVDFGHVAGSLRAAGRPSGFAITDVTGRPMAAIYDIEVCGCRAALRSDLAAAALEGSGLYYGHGLNPYCNITDGLDRSLPVFGPVRIGKPRAVNPKASPVPGGAARGRRAVSP